MSWVSQDLTISINKKAELKRFKGALADRQKPPTNQVKEEHVILVFFVSKSFSQRLPSTPLFAFNQ